jgi:putative ABC transport system permease protein
MNHWRVAARSLVLRLTPSRYFSTFILKNLTRRPTRTVLTILGLALATASMITLLGISNNAERAVQTSFEQRGIDLIVQQAGRSSGFNSDFTEYFVDETKKIPGVKQVASAVVNLIDVTRDSGYSDQVLIQGWNKDNFGFEVLDIISGRKFEPGEIHKVMLGNSLAKNLNKKVGDTIVFGRQDSRNNENVYEVVGIYKSGIVFQDGSAVVSIADGRRLTGMRVTGFSVRVDKSNPDSIAEIEAVREKIEALQDPQDPSVQLSAQTPATFITSLSHLRMVKALTWVVSIVAMLIGMIGMLNTMAMSVLERTQEIGILRAVGWPPRRVLRMILGEATLLSLIAAAVGTAGAWVGLHLLTLSPKVNGFIEGRLAPVVIAEGIAITLLIGLLGGMFPAFRAARFLPTEAIRHD